MTRESEILGRRMDDIIKDFKTPVPVATSAVWFLRLAQVLGLYAVNTSLKRARTIVSPIVAAHQILMLGFDHVLVLSSYFFSKCVCERARTALL